MREKRALVGHDWPDVIHIDMRSPTRNSYLGGRGWATTLWRELRRQLPSLKFLHLTPLPSSVNQLLNSMRTNPVGKPKDAHVQVYPTINLVHTPGMQRSRAWCGTPPIWVLLIWLEPGI